MRRGRGSPEKQIDMIYMINMMLKDIFNPVNHVNPVKFFVPE
jgi:hypothetical protein